MELINVKLLEKSIVDLLVEAGSIWSNPAYQKYAVEAAGEYQYTQASKNDGEVLAIYHNGEFSGITGYWISGFGEDRPILQLRWTGIIPSLRGFGLSRRIMLELKSRLAGEYSQCMLVNVAYLESTHQLFTNKLGFANLDDCELAQRLMADAGGGNFVSYTLTPSC